ncbi:RNase adapter RapZ [Dokdonella ginsengisoli]|uniref:RNase adapter RapZ n=1 Tax=Dokdonella ginsengisoli TaxID=363846 RepID=A0ABV9QRV9_9GAMM
MVDTPADTASPTDQLIIVSGLSGSGKTVALRTLEDLGYYCVDNLPAALMPSFVQALSQNAAGLRHKLAVGVDVRNRAENLNRLPQILAELAQADIGYRLVFLDTRDEVLIKRYSETRRRHPLSDGLGLADAIAEERRLLRPMLAIADRTIDTSDLNVHQLRRLIITEMGLAAGAMTLLFESFAYRRGVPTDADFVFDARCLPNPHWDAKLRPLSGKDSPVREWLEGKAEVGEFRDDLTRFLESWLPRFEHDGRSYVTICIGCTGGRHRSVYLCERLAEHFRQRYAQVLTYHRELE